jgi:hypothetical protein
VINDDKALQRWVDGLIQARPEVLNFKPSHIPLDAKRMSPRSLVDHLNNSDETWQPALRIVIDPEDLEQAA